MSGAFVFPDAQQLALPFCRLLARETPRERAMTYAVHLDSLEATADDEMQDRLLRAAATIGGLSDSGFTGALSAALDQVEEDALMDELGRDFRPGVGTDPDGYVSPYLERQIERAQDMMAADWEAVARRIVEEV